MSYKDFITTMLSERLTFETKFNVLIELKYSEATYTSVARLYNLSVSKVIRLFDKHINEHYLPNSERNTKYCFLFLDFLSGEMVDILPSRRKSYLVDYLGDIKNSTIHKDTGLSELNNVKYIFIDMYDTYRDIAHIFFPNAKVCAGSFHVLKHLTERELEIDYYIV